MYRPPRQHVLKWHEIFHQTTLHLSSEASRDKPQSLLNQSDLDHEAWIGVKIYDWQLIFRTFFDFLKFLLHYHTQANLWVRSPRQLAQQETCPTCFTQCSLTWLWQKASHSPPGATICFFANIQQMKPPFLPDIFSVKRVIAVWITFHLNSNNLTIEHSAGVKRENEMSTCDYISVFAAYISTIVYYDWFYIYIYYWMWLILGDKFISGLT